MIELFKSRFPFVEQPNETLTKEQQKIKKEYDRLRAICKDAAGVGGKPKRS